MSAATRLLLIIICLGLVPGGCFTRTVRPTVQSLDLEQANPGRINDLVMTQRVVLERRQEKVGRYASEKSVERVSTSRFGKEHDIASLECFITGLRDVLPDLNITSTGTFWDRVGKQTDTLHLMALFDAEHASAVETLELDFLVLAYHQRIDLESFFMEAIAEGGYSNIDLEVAAAATVDMEKRRMIDAIQIEARHETHMGHAVAVIPLGARVRPDEDPCLIAGRHAAAALSGPVSGDRPLRIAVVASTTNPYVILSAPDPAPRPGQH